MLESVIKTSELNLSGECLGRYCHNHRLSFIASILLSLFLATALWGHVSHSSLFSWLTLVLLAQAGQAWYSRRCLSTLQGDSVQAQAWMPGLLTGSIVTGLCWGSSLFFMDVAGLGPVAIMLIFALAGITAYAGIAKADLFISAMVFEIAALLPLGMWLFMQEGEISQFLGIITLLYLGLLYFLLRQLNEMTTQSHALRGRNVELAAALAREQILEREGAMFRNMFETIADPAVVVHDPRDNNRIVYANDAACRHFGTDRETLRSWSPRDFDTRITPEKGKVLNEALQKHGRFAFQSAHRRADGEEVPVEVVINMFRHEGTELMVTFVRNISKRLAAEERMRELEFAAVRQEGDQRMGRFLECVPGLFFTLRRDRDGVMTMPFARGSSPSFQGLSPEVVAESVEPLLALCHPDDVDPLLAELHASAQEMRPCHAEFRIGDLSQRQMTMELTAQPLRGAEPGVMEWHGFMQDVTERRKMEELLRMKGHALEHSSEAMYLIGDQGRFVYVNEQACRSLGYSRDELLAMSVIDIDPDFSLPLLQDRTERVLHESGSFVFETRHQRRDSSTFPVEIQMSELKYNGQVLGMALVRDITERKLAEKALRDSEAMLQEAQRIAHVGSWDVDMVNDRLTWSDEIFRIWEIDKTKFRANFAAFLETVHPEDRERVNRVYYEAVKNHTLYEVEHRLLFPDGRVKHILERGEPQYDEQGKPVRFIGTSLDITERKQMEAVMQERGDLLQAIMESSPEIIVFALDQEYRYLSFNDKHRQVMQAIWGKEIAVGMSMLDEVIGSHADREVAKQGFDRALSGEIFVEESAYGDEALSREYWQTFWSPIRSGTGEVSGLTCFVLNISERKRVETALEAREREFRSLAGNLPDNMARFDTEGRYLYVNPTHERTLGMKAEDLIGQFIPDSHEQVKAGVKQVAATGQAIHAVRQPVMVDGVEELHDVSLVPEFDEAGKVVSVLGIGRDMTERYRMQETIAAHEQEFRSLAENISDHIVRWDVEGRYLYINPAHERLLGVSLDELAPMSFADSDEPLHAAFRQVIATGQPQQIEQHVTVAGHDEIHSVNLVPECDAEGKVISVLALGRDMTRYLRMQEAIAAREQEFRSLAESAPDNIIRYDLEGRCRYLNKQLVHQLGLTSMEEVLGKRPGEVWPDGRFDQIEQAAARAVETGEVQVFEMVGLDANGESYFGQISVVPERGENGDIIGTIAFGRDITNLRSTERLMQMIGDHLPGAVTQYRLRSDLSGEVLYASQGLQELYGVTREMLADGLGPMIALIHPDDLPKAVAEQEHAAKTLTTAVSEFRINHPAKGERWVQQITTPVPESEDSLLWYSLMFDITERKRLEVALGAREAEFRSLAENSPDAIFRYNKDCRRIYVNQTVERLTGKSRDELLGKSPIEFAPNQAVNPHQAQQCIRAVLEGGKPVELEMNFTAADGREVTIHNVFVPEFAADGHVQGVLCLGRDITERKWMEQTLVEREAFLDSLFEAIPVPVFSKDREGRYLKINRAFEQYYGADRNQMIGKSVFDTHPRELAETYHAKDVEVFERRVELQQYEYQIKHSDGTLRDVLFSKAAFADSQGEVKGLIGAVMDITRRKRAEIELQQRFDEIHQLNDRLESHARLLEEQTVEMEAAQEQLKQTESWYRGILHSAPDGMMVVDELGRITLVNEELERMFGFERGELVGQAMEVLLPADMRTAHVGMRKGFIGKGSQSGVPMLASNLRACRKDGSEFVVDVTLSRLPENDYNAGAICAAVRDVTERKKAENELRQRYDEIHQLNDRLESHARLLEEQTTELEASQVQLKQALDFSQGVINAVPDILFEVDREGRYLNFWWNDPNAPEGYKTAMLGKTVYEALPQEAAEQAMAAIREADATGRSYGHTIPIALPNGEVHWYEHSIARKHGDTPADTTFIALSRDVTGRKQAERAMVETRNRLKNVLQTIPDLVWLKNAEGVYLACNPAFERFYGASEAEIIGKTDHDFVDAELADFFRKKDQEAIKAGTVCMNEEWVTYADDGRRGLLETRKVPVFDAEGKVVGVLGVARDITERKRMEQELHRREREFRTLVDSLPDPFFRYDRNHRRTYVNAKVEQLTGKSAESLLGLSVAESQLASPQWNALLDHEVGRVLETGQPSTSAMEYQTLDGQTRYFDCWLGPVFDNDGTPDSVMLLMRDITDIKVSELKLAEREREFRTLVENVNDVVVRYDRECRRTYVNPAWVRVNGIPAEEAVGKSPQELAGRIRPMSREFESMLREVMLLRQVRSMDLVWDDETGTQVCFQLEAVPEFNSEGEVIGVLTVARDITERKRMESALALREQEFRTLVENAADTVARYGKDMRRLYANPAFAQLVEGGVEALLGKTPAEVPGGAHAEIYEEKLGEVISTGKETEFELKWHDKSGRELCSLINLTPEFGKDGKVESVLAVGRDISELHAFRQKIHQMAFYDSLTSLPNRALFNDRLRQMIADASWHHQLAGVMMIDMDRFKAVNDTMGHAVGDELLRETGARLNACVRAYDTVARLGGDEFAVLLPEVRNADDLGRVADKMRSVFDAPFILDGKEVFISCSIGIALYPNDSSDADDLLKYADSAMYYAKRTGRNNFRFYSRDLTESANERLMLESDLRRATERGELELYYQPKVSLVDGCMIGSEALLRWKHPTHGMIPPDKFIPVAEDSGLILEIGEWVLRDACRAACEFNGENKSLHKVAINLSARQFLSNDLVATVCEVLDETGCRPEWIELEITESLLLDEDGDVLGTLKAFRALGITIAIDDFGTGYSALSYLARFPISTLKVDRSFVRSIEADTFRAELVKAILSIAHCLGQQVVAEGVETPGQAVFLQAHGCHVAQGYLFSKPVAKGEFMKLPGRFEV